jgi:hypothetical protein
MANEVALSDEREMIKQAFLSQGYVEVRPGVYESTENLQQIDSTRIKDGLDRLIEAVR